MEVEAKARQVEELAQGLTGSPLQSSDVSSLFSRVPMALVCSNARTLIEVEDSQRQEV